MIDLARIGLPARVVDVDGREWTALYFVNEHNGVVFYIACDTADVDGKVVLPSACFMIGVRR